MFRFAFLAFVIFSGLYTLFFVAVIYHLRKYALPASAAPKTVSFVFTTLAFLLWSTALYFLLQI